MKTKTQIKKWILENCIDKNGTIDLSNLDFGDRRINLSEIRAKVISNNYQEAKEIYNTHQKAQEIYNNFQKAEKEIYNGYQKSFKKGGE